MTPDYFIGLDLGQATDYTALAILERTEKVVETPVPGKPPRKDHVPHFGCRGLKRWPLGTPYTTIVTQVKEIVSNPVLGYPRLMVDATGVGRPVVDMFWNAQLPAYMIPVMITAGTQESKQDRYYHVAKIILISTLQVLLQQRRLQFAEALQETPTLIKELQNYRVKISQAAHEIYEAREGEHDDLILAIALAAWQADKYRTVQYWVSKAKPNRWGFKPPDLGPLGRVMR